MYTPYANCQQRWPDSQARTGLIACGLTVSAPFFSRTNCWRKPPAVEYSASVRTSAGLFKLKLTSVFTFALLCKQSCLSARVHTDGSG